ncbi:hypothetical protein CPB84DRAFT_1774662 [Gymnopilus junonius]|uniref:G3BP-like protein n=1 Tax=Gymnopilus junonius TaxID=109634 RepID=A0A9P5NNU0_GYMJU|nr:hypothetical protein CPB84DRAFT_1774662 [Gymnopilus junonius]
MTATAPSSQHSNVVPSEVGWQFVPQYYTFVNKEPHRLHCFYNKNSTFIHGTEGEEVKACHGQQEIHNKITSIGFDDCKVFIHSVDAQSSLNGGIIIQVIGEMSNHGEEWRKFVQTFFLAEQPNGYFVLNDIFRFLKEETVDSEDASDVAEEPATAPPPAAAPAPVPVVPAPVAPVVKEPPAPIQPVAAPEPVYEPPREPTPPPAAPVPEPTPLAAPIEEAPTTDIPEPVAAAPSPAPAQEAPAAPAPQPNGIHPAAAEPEKPAAAPAVAPAAPTEPSPAPTPAPVVPQPQRPATPAAPQPAAAPAAPSPAQQQPPAPAAAPPPRAAPVQPAAPSAPRSWASLAASNSKKWGPAVAQESRGTTEAAAAPPAGGPGAPSPAPAAPAQRPQGQQQHGGQRQGPGHQQQHQGPKHGQGQGAHGHEPHPTYVAAQSITTPQCFIKGVTEPISQTLLSSTLTTRFGAIKDLEIVRAKACAFLEFQSLESAKKAITASLPQHQGGEGGVWLDVGGEVGQVRISVETKKERGDRPVSRPRGGAPGGEGRGGPGGQGQGGQGAHVNGDGRGGFRGGRGGGRGRGGAGGK